MSALSWFRQQLRKVSSIIALIGGALAIAFLIWVFGDSERRIASIDHRNVADLAILVDNLEQWPRAAQSIGDANFYSGSWQAPILRPVKGGIEKELYHPDFDTFWIRYSAGNPD